MNQQHGNFYKYVTVSEDAKDWGVYLTGAGHKEVSKHTRYPLVDDPSHHYFHWTTGRKLSDYQIIYITKGRGVFESELSGLQSVNTGDAFVLFPGLWHRFKPDENSGWKEYWVEFNGDLIKHYQLKQYLNPEQPLITVGIVGQIAESYLKILELVKEEKPGFQYIASGILIQLLGQLIVTIKYQPFEGKQIEAQIKQAKLHMLENIRTEISQEELAKSIGIGYSLYRKKFKEYTGLSPAQYHIQLRINTAKELLVATNLSLKEISYQLGFDYVDYFFRLFKKKTGYSPSDYRNKNQR